MFFRTFLATAFLISMPCVAIAAQPDTGNKDNVNIDVCVSGPSDSVCFQAESVNFAYVRRRGMRPVVEEFEITKPYDENTAALIDWMTKGRRLAGMTIEYSRRDTREIFHSIEVTTFRFTKARRMSSTEILPVDVFTMKCDTDTSEILFVDAASGTMSSSSC